MGAVALEATLLEKSKALSGRERGELNRLSVFFLRNRRKEGVKRTGVSRRQSLCTVDRAAHLPRSCCPRHRKSESQACGRLFFEIKRPDGDEKTWHVKLKQFWLVPFDDPSRPLARPFLLICAPAACLQVVSSQTSHKKKKASKPLT